MRLEQDAPHSGLGRPHGNLHRIPDSGKQRGRRVAVQVYSSPDIDRPHVALLQQIKSTVAANNLDSLTRGTGAW